MLITCFVAGVPRMPSTIPRLVPVEVVELPLPALGYRPVIAIVRVEAIVHMAVKSVMAVEPGPRSNKYSAVKPVLPVIAVGSTLIGLIVKVPIGAFRRHTNTDANLRASLRCATDQRHTECCKSKNFTVRHNFSFNLLGNLLGPRGCGNLFLLASVSPARVPLSEQ